VKTKLKLKSSGSLKILERCCCAVVGRGIVARAGGQVYAAETNK